MIGLLPYQMDFLQAPEEEVAFVAGIGTGKTYAGSLFAITETSSTPKVPGLIVANTYGQLMSSTLVKLKTECEKHGISYKLKTQDKVVIVNGTEHFIRSAEQANNSRGIEAGWLWVDEAAFMTEEDLNIFEGRIRYQGGSLKKRYTSTPSGFNWLFHRFAPEGDQFSKSRRLIRAKTEDNYLLPPTYASTLRGNYSGQMASQELDAEFISFAGSRCYSDFDRKKHVQPTFAPDITSQVYCVMDYNVDPYAAVLVYLDRMGRIVVFDEIYLEGGADVRMMSAEIKKRMLHLPIVIGDSTGNNRRNVANLKDTAYKIFAEQGLRTGEFHNPNVNKRLGNVNRLFFHNQVIIDPKCTRLISDLELVKYKEGSNDIDKTTNTKLTHISDAFGYACWKLHPWVHEQRSRSYDV